MGGKADRLVILGASSMVAHHLARLPQMADRQALFVSRSPASEGMDSRYLQASAEELPPAVCQGAVMVSLMPLPATAAAAPTWPDVRGIVALGSTSRWVKQNSTDALDKAASRALETAEADLARRAAEQQLPVTVLRPTLVWDGSADHNVTAVARFIHRFGFFPVAGRATGGRQPIHAADVARACLCAADRGLAGFNDFDLPGGETLPYREMVRRIFAAMGRPDRTISLPTPLLTAGLAALRTLRGTDHSPSLFGRMNVDQVFDGKAASEALGIAPGGFRPSFPWLAQVSG